MDGDGAYEDALQRCGQCRQGFEGSVKTALKRATWLHFAGRAETDSYHQTAHYNMAATLVNGKRLEEALIFAKEQFAMMVRVYGRYHTRTYDAEECIAMNLRLRGGAENLQSALQILVRIHTQKSLAFGRDNEETFRTTAQLAAVYGCMGNFSQALLLRREILAPRRRILGETHALTLEAYISLALELISLRQFDEAREIRDRILPLVTRVLGPDHRLTRVLRDAEFARRPGD